MKNKRGGGGRKKQLYQTMRETKYDTKFDRRWKSHWRTIRRRSRNCFSILPLRSVIFILFSRYDYYILWIWIFTRGTHNGTRASINACEIQYFIYICIYISRTRLRIYSGESQRAVDHRTTLLLLLPAVVIPTSSSGCLSGWSSRWRWRWRVCVYVCVCACVRACVRVYVCVKKMDGKRGHDFLSRFSRQRFSKVT